MTPSNYVPGIRRRQFTPLYDTYVKAASALPATIQMFGNVAGSAGINITNMKKAYELPGTEKFTLYALRVVPLAITEADWILLIKGYIVRLIRGRVVELEAGLEYFAGGAGISTPTAASVAVNNGIPDPRAVASLPQSDPIVIEGGDTFEVNLVGPAAVTVAAAVWLRVYLDGAFDKGVQ